LPLPRRDSIGIEEEPDEQLQDFASRCNVILLAIIAPFVPARVSPRRVTYAQLYYTEEFMLEEFVQLVEERYPDKSQRPSLYLLLHTPGGGVNSAYVIASVLQDTFSRIVGIIPHMAASGGTLIALSCNELILGRISQLTSIDPYESDGEDLYAASEISAFGNLVEYFRNTSHEDAPFPYVHLATSMTPQRYDRATRLMAMVESYTTQLLSGAGYEEERAKKIVQAFLWQTETHGQVFRYSRIQELELNARLYTGNDDDKQVWGLMRDWLKRYYLQPSSVHFVRYVLPSMREATNE
jgi:hypothetical protein